jgi:malate permease and related proteins
VVFAVSLVFFRLAGRVLRWSRATEGALVLTCGLGNTSFVGLPLVRAFFGPEGLPTAVLLDQLGTFLVLSTLGFATAAFASGRGLSFSRVTVRLLTFPAFLCLPLAMLLRSWEYPPFLLAVLHPLSELLTPLALLSVVWRLVAFREKGRGKERLGSVLLRPLVVALTYRLVLAPAAVIAVYGGILGQRGLSAQVVFLEAAMGPMIMGAVISREFGLAPVLADRVLLIGIPLSLLTASAWMQLIRLF